MKKIVISMLLAGVVILSGLALAADVKVSELPTAASMATGDTIPFTSDPGGNPATKQITRENLFTSAPLTDPLADHILEKTAGHGVSIDSVLLKDGVVTTTGITAPSNSLIIKPTADETTAIQFADKDGNAILTVDTTNNRLGINTTPGAAALHIQPLSRSLNGVLITDTDGTNVASVFVGSTGAGSFYLYDAANATSVQLSSSTGSFIKDGTFVVGATAVVGSEKARVAGDLYVDGNMSALTITDRTPYYEGDALAEIARIRGVDGQIDHSTLPDFVQKPTTKNIYEDQAKIEKGEDGVGKNVTVKVKVGEKTVTERDLGAMISMLTVAVQQLTVRVQELEAAKNP